MRKFLNGLYLTTGWLSAFCVLMICVLMIAQSVLREMGVRTGAVNDVVAWMCAAAAFLSMAHAFKHGDFVRVTLLLEKLSPKTRHWYELGCLTVGIVAVGYMTYWATAFTYESYVFHDVSDGLIPMPKWIPELSFVIGSWVFLIAIVDEWFLVFQGRRPTFVVAVEERHAAGDFSSDV